MTICPQCHCLTTAEDQFCRQCGHLLGTPSGVPPARPNRDVTVRFTGSEVAARREQRSAVALETLFAVKPLIVIGRSPDCDIYLPHPSVSRYHALLERSTNGLLLRDLGSVNGIFVGGKRVADSSVVREGERVGIGPFLFTLAHGVLTSLDSSRSLRLEARNLERVIALKAGGTRKLLDNINLVIEPGEFVRPARPVRLPQKHTDGCGSSGRRRATLGGRVLANGEDFYRHFDSFRQSLGYVPQRDIIHTQLTVSRALAYTARLRLPGDTAHSELRTRVEEVLREMGIGAPSRHARRQPVGWAGEDESAWGPELLGAAVSAVHR